MSRSPRTTWGLLVLAWLAFVLWQFFSCRHEQYLIRETVGQQAHSVMNALTGGIRSHRRLGRFVQLQLSGILEGLAATPDVLAVEVLTGDGQRLVSAGNTGILQNMDWKDPGGYWDAAGFRLVSRFDVEASPMGDSQGYPAGPGSGGRGFGRIENEHEEFDRLRREGGTLVTVLLLDRRRADALFASAIWSHAIVALAGGLVLIGLGIAWHSNLRLVAERTRSELLEMEARHYRDLGQSAAGLAHETRNPLGLIRGWAERLAGAADDPETNKQARLLIEECDRVTARINEFLAFTRPYQPELAEVQPVQLVEELIAILQPDLESKNITVNIDRQGRLAPIQADRELLRQALFNLLQNAIQSSPPSSNVEIRIIADTEGPLRIEVADQGPGVPPELVESLFSPYFTTREAGTGLGLAIVRKIAVAHGWAACYKSRVGGGSIFSLEGITDGSQTNHSDR